MRVTVVCDLFGDGLDQARQSAPEARAFEDHRALLDSGDLDAVVIATPDHWHAMIALDAMTSGRDVYVEKPLTLKIEEGAAIIQTARSLKRVCQVGMQQRSGTHYRVARDEYVKKLGKVTLVRTWWHGNSTHVRMPPAEYVRKPVNLNWERYVEPVKWRACDPRQFFNFRAHLDFGGGQITDWFTHWVDVAHMLLGIDIPTTPMAAGGIYHYADGRTAPDTISLLLEYAIGCTITFEGTLAPGARGEGVEVLGTEGRLFITRGSFDYQAAGRGAKVTRVEASEDLNVAHIQNFWIACAAGSCRTATP